MCKNVDITIIARGRRCRVICAKQLNCREPVADFLRKLRKTDKEKLAKIVAKFKKLADAGEIHNELQFKHIKDHIWEVKIGQFRFPCFRYKNDWIVTHGFKKKQDKWPPGELERANRIRRECIGLLKGK